ncbi:MAG TPA: IS66 family transposase [Anaerolineaceae bacterium]|nr:IS66 family transposase [Anaerolineaceae bacterium]
MNLPPGLPIAAEDWENTPATAQAVVFLPTVCQECGALLLGEDPQPERHQVSEVPKPAPIIIKYQRHTLNCAVCGAQNRAEWPKDMPRGSFGERLQGLIAYLGGRFGVSQRDMEEMLERVFQVEIGLGSIPAQQQRVSQALQQPVEAAQQYVQTQTTVNLDETGWHELTKNVWLWVCSTPSVTVFRIFQGRGGSRAEELLGGRYASTVGSDRYSAYNWLDPLQRQVCWPKVPVQGAHLKRDFQAWVERGGESAVIGRLLLACLKQFFGFWHRVRDGTLARGDFQARMQPIREEVVSLLEIGALLDHGETRRASQNILKLKQALGTFVDREGVEPTNNAAERALPVLAVRPGRRGVIWRRRSYGTQSENGSLFVERILTVVTALRQQKRDVLDYLADACKAATLGIPAPSLLPAD